MTLRPELDRLLRESADRVAKMTPEELETMKREQAKSWVRSVVDWPKPKFKWVRRH